MRMGSLVLYDSKYDAVTRTIWTEDPDFRGVDCPVCGPGPYYLQRHYTAIFAGRGIPVLTCLGCGEWFLHDPNGLLKEEG